MLSQIIDPKARREPSKFAKVWIVLVSLLSIAWGVSWLLHQEWPGGMRSSYPAADYDDRLTQEARLALPLIAAIRRYRDSHSNTLPEDLNAIRADLPRETDPQDDMTHGWTFVPGESGQFRLYRRLGWDPTLWFGEDAGVDTWTFDPGDGTPTKTLKLKP